MIIYGWGKQTVKDYGESKYERCGNCDNPHKTHVIKITKWFTLFFIPIIPYSKKYYFICPACKSSREIDKHDIKRIIAEDILNY